MVTGLRVLTRPFVSQSLANQNLGVAAGMTHSDDLLSERDVAASDSKIAVETRKPERPIYPSMVSTFKGTKNWKDLIPESGVLEIPKAMEEPRWLQSIKEKFISGASSVFTLSGNVHDLIPITMEGGVKFCAGISEYLTYMLSKTDKTVIRFSMYEGMTVELNGNRLAPEKALVAVNLCLGAAGQGQLSELPGEQDISSMFYIVRQILFSNKYDVSVVLEDPDLLMRADTSFASELERSHISMWRRLPGDAKIKNTNNSVFMVTDQLSGMNASVAQAPGNHKVEVGYPNVETRLYFIMTELMRMDETAGLSVPELEMSVEVLADMTAGLKLTQIRDLLNAASKLGETITFKKVIMTKKKIIEQECGGLIEFLAPNHGLDQVAGLDGAKAELLRVAEAIKEGRKKEVPLGMLFAGPMGTGKTYLAEAFAKDSGMVCLKLGNIRGSLVGETEKNLEKVLSLIETLGNVALIIDEADRALNAGEGGQSSDVESRLIARLKEFMSDKKRKGKSIFIMMTTRPDKIDVDLKRQGRTDIKIPFFFPYNVEERKEHYEIGMRKLKAQVVIPERDRKLLFPEIFDVSAEEVRAITVEDFLLAVAASSQDAVDPSKVYSAAEISGITENSLIQARERRNRILEIKNQAEQLLAALSQEEFEVSSELKYDALIYMLDLAKEANQEEFQNVIQERGDKKLSELTDNEIKSYMTRFIKIAERIDAAEGDGIITAGDLYHAFNDFKLSRDEREMELMLLLGIFESSSNRMLPEDLPEKYKGMTLDQIQARINQIKTAIRLNSPLEALNRTSEEVTKDDQNELEIPARKEFLPQEPAQLEEQLGWWKRFLRMIGFLS